jgi:hypothetical protein
LTTVGFTEQIPHADGIRFCRSSGRPRSHRWAAAEPATASTEIDVRDGSKGLLLVEVLKRRVRARNEKRQESPDDELLVVIRYRDWDDQTVTLDDHAMWVFTTFFPDERVRS